MFLVKILVIPSLLLFSAITCQDEDLNIYTVEAYVVCDNACNTRLQRQGYNPVRFLSELIEETDLRISSLNVSVVLIGLEIWNRTDMIPVDQTLSAMRVDFSEYRVHTQLDAAGRWSDVSVLVTGRDALGTSDDPNGLMPLAGCCTRYAGAGVVKYTIQNTETLAATLAHEIGHALGLTHDANGCCSAGLNKCMMSATFDSSHIYAPQFSQCSKEEVKEYLLLPRSECLRNRPGSGYVPPGVDTCGNGVVDEGEACDCGAGCLAGCCECCQQCQLVEGAQCYQGTCCDIPSCTIRGAGTTCRDARHQQCDLEDVCDGQSSDCRDIVQPEGTPCADNLEEEGYCFGGGCLTRNEQCYSEWGAGYIDGADICYTSGITAPSWFVNCGTRPNGFYIPCRHGEKNHYKCAMLQCGGPDDTSNLSPFKEPRINNFIKSDVCLSGKYGDWVGKQGSILVKNGTKCGDGLACFDGDCISLDVVLNSTEPAQGPGYICGDGVVDPGETCDCGPYQCDCCDPITCTLRQAGEAGLYDACHICDGVSTLCTSTTSSDYTLCDSDSGLCIEGECRSHDRACRNIFGPEAKAAGRNIYLENSKQNSSQHNGGGYLLYDRSTSSWSTSSREFIPSPSDGNCGILLCETSANAVIEDDGGQELKSKTFYVRYNSSIRVAYFSIETTTKHGKVYDRYYPVLAEEGTPCTTEAGEVGYCQAKNLAIDKWRWNWYWYSRCIPRNQ